MAKFIAFLLVVGSLVGGSIVFLRPDLIKPFLYPQAPIDESEYRRFVYSLPFVLDSDSEAEWQELLSKTPLLNLGKSSRAWVFRDGISQILYCDLEGCTYQGQNYGFATKELNQLISRKLAKTLESRPGNQCGNLVLQFMPTVPFKYVRDVLKKLPFSSCAPKVATVVNRQFEKWPNLPLAMSKPLSEIISSKLKTETKIRDMLTIFKKNNALACSLNQKMYAPTRRRGIKEVQSYIAKIIESPSLGRYLEKCTLTTYEQQYFTRLLLFGVKEGGKGLSYKSLRLKLKKDLSEKTTYNQWSDITDALISSDRAELDLEI